MKKEEIQSLIEKAWEGFEKSYSPYSKFPVGAAVLGSNGKVYIGCNIENVSFGLTNCAERTALFTMVADGCKTFDAIAVVADTPQITPPCGACRQVMAEFCKNKDVPVFLSTKEKTVEETVESILPYTFVSLDTNAK